MRAWVCGACVSTEDSQPNETLDLLFRDAVSVTVRLPNYMCPLQPFFSNAMDAPDCSCSVRVVDVYPYRMQSDVLERLLLRRAENDFTLLGISKKSQHVRV